LLATDVAIKAPCRAATTANITLNGLQTVDGIVLVANDRVLVKNQTSGVNNGIYLASTGSWTRTSDFDGNRDAVDGTLVLVRLGTASALALYELSCATSPANIGTTSLTFNLVSVVVGNAGSFTTLTASGQITSSLATGTAPLVIASTTKVANLNADLLDGTDWNAPGTIGAITPGAATFTTATATGAMSGATVTATGLVSGATGKVTTTFGVGNTTPSVSGSGVSFPATQSASTDVNTLDDYEEGTWTPSVGGTATYTVQTGTYTKAGRLVFIQGSIQINAIGTGSTTVISGLPFVNIASAATAIAVASTTSSVTNIVSISGAIASSTSQIILESRTAASASDTTNAIFQNGTVISFSGCYQTT
jgi:hypothetical protein